VSTIKSNSWSRSWKKTNNEIKAKIRSWSRIRSWITKELNNNVREQLLHANRLFAGLCRTGCTEEIDGLCHVWYRGSGSITGAATDPHTPHSDK
jgi:hypothetical protein